MVILNMLKELYHSCYSIVCCQYYNLNYNIPTNIDYSNVEYSNIEQNDILVSPNRLDTIILDIKQEKTKIDDEYDIIDNEYDIIDGGDINI